MSRKGFIISITVIFLQDQKTNEKRTEITLKMLNNFEEVFENIRSWMDR